MVKDQHLQPQSHLNESKSQVGKASLSLVSLVIILDRKEGFVKPLKG